MSMSKDTTWSTWWQAPLLVGASAAALAGWYLTSRPKKGLSRRRTRRAGKRHQRVHWHQEAACAEGSVYSVASPVPPRVAASRRADLVEARLPRRYLSVFAAIRSDPSSSVKSPPPSDSATASVLASASSASTSAPSSPASSPPASASAPTPSYNPAAAASAAASPASGTEFSLRVPSGSASMRALGGYLRRWSARAGGVTTVDADSASLVGGAIRTRRICRDDGFNSLLACFGVNDADDCDNVFDAWDADGEDRLDAGELAHTLVAFAPKPALKGGHELRDALIFDAYDVTGQGCLSRAEFRRFHALDRTLSSIVAGTRLPPRTREDAAALVDHVFARAARRRHGRGGGAEGGVGGCCGGSKVGSPGDADDSADDSGALSVAAATELSKVEFLEWSAALRRAARGGAKRRRKVREIAADGTLPSSSSNSAA